jgi:two-component system, NtrC family, response regulator HydG
MYRPLMGMWRAFQLMIFRDQPKSISTAAYLLGRRRYYLGKSYMNILVVDDEESIRFTFASFLTEAGHNITTAESYREAVTLIVTERFDLIFSDIMLGRETGIDLLRTIRETDNEVPIIMITGNPTVETAVEAVRLGAFDYIQKPVTQDMLLKAVRTVTLFISVQHEKNRYQANLESIFRSVRDGIITVDSGMNILEMNDAAVSLCGRSRNLCGGPFDALPAHCSGTCLTTLRRVVQNKQPIELFRVTCGRRDRPGQVVNLHASPLLNGTGTHCGAVLVIRDESRIDTLERNLRERKQLHTIIGGSEKMQQLYALIENLADVDSTVLITSESGTGKELVAEALHFRGCRSDKSLIKVNCSALPESLLESELFGHAKGSFTGAVKDKAGRFEMADGGSLFLDEIGDISPSMQVKLLRVLQEKEFERVGETRPRKIDVRVIAATNQNLVEKVRRGTFREDLYYRLNVVKLAIPPLRERLGDLNLLVDHFLRKFSTKFHKDIGAVDDQVMAILGNHRWPGNVRELEHTIEFACIMCPNGMITREHLPPDFQTTAATLPAQDKMQSISSEALNQALVLAGGNKSKAARILGISRRTIYRKLD